MSLHRALEIRIEKLGRSLEKAKVSKGRVGITIPVRLHSVPGSCNDWTMKALETAVPRREEACAVCAVKDWLENRFRVYLFKEGTESTTWRRFFYGCEEDDAGHEEEDASKASSSGAHRVEGHNASVAASNESGSHSHRWEREGAHCSSTSWLFHCDGPADRWQQDALASSRLCDEPCVWAFVSVSHT